MSEDSDFEVRINSSHDESIARVTDALKSEGFGVLTRIDIDQAFKEKIGADFRPYTILGACNPKLAHAALSSNPEIGLMLPCNVTVEATDSGSLVRFTDPSMMMQMGNLKTDEVISGVAVDAAERLKRVAVSLNELS